MKEPDIPVGLVFSVNDTVEKRVYYNIILDTTTIKNRATGEDRLIFLADILYLNKRGKLKLYQTAAQYDSSIFFDLFRNKTLFLLHPTQFDAFKQFYTISDISPSTLRLNYPKAEKLIRSTHGLERIVSSSTQ